MESSKILDIIQNPGSEAVLTNNFSTKNIGWSGPPAHRWISPTRRTRITKGGNRNDDRMPFDKMFEPWASGGWWWGTQGQGILENDSMREVGRGGSKWIGSLRDGVETGERDDAIDLRALVAESMDHPKMKQMRLAGLAILRADNVRCRRRLRILWDW